jgi:hypothetical protein
MGGMFGALGMFMRFQCGIVLHGPSDVGRRQA